MTNDDPADGDSPDAVQAVEVARVGLVGHDDQHLGVLVQAEAQE